MIDDLITVRLQNAEGVPAYSYTRTELLSLRTKTFLLSLSTVDRLKDLNIGYHLPRRHRSSRGVKRKKQNVHPFIVASFNAQAVKGMEEHKVNYFQGLLRTGKAQGFKTCAHSQV